MKICINKPGYHLHGRIFDGTKQELAVDFGLSWYGAFLQKQWGAQKNGDDILADCYVIDDAQLGRFAIPAVFCEVV